MGWVVVPAWSHVSRAPRGPHGGPRQEALLCSPWQPGALRVAGAPAGGCLPCRSRGLCVSGVETRAPRGEARLGLPLQASVSTEVGSVAPLWLP